MTIEQAFQQAVEHQQRGRLDLAVTAYQQALAINANIPALHFNLANVLTQLRRFDEAIASYRNTLALNPRIAEAQYNLGTALMHTGRPDQAVAAYRQAASLSPDHAQTYNNLGIALQELGRVDEALAAFAQAVAKDPKLAPAQSNQGNVLARLGRLDEAVAAYEKAIALRPDHAEVHDNLANSLKHLGRPDDAATVFRRAMAMRPDNARIHSDYLLSLLYHPDFDAAALLGEFRQWDGRHGRPLRAGIAKHENDRNGERRLKIGYVSADFRDHVIGWNLLPVLAAHDHAQFEIVYYANVARPDRITERYRGMADQWRDIARMTDNAAAKLIRDDRIDILVDLSLHTGGNRLLVFARKPAPVQVSYAGYPGGTGLSAIDYRLTDPYLDPPGQGDDQYVEQSIRLRDTFLCFDPAMGDLPEVLEPGPLPAHANGFVTFGSLNAFGKINDGVLRLWAKVLSQVPNSRLRLLAPPGSARRRVTAVLGDGGIAPERIGFVERQSRANYFRVYQTIDIGLDTLPYNGHTTSLDSMWMGVPVVTLLGQTIVGRLGWSELSNLGLTELAATDERQFISIAAGLAADLPRLAGLRASLRQRMAESPLTDARRFTRSMEVAYRDIWKRWCSQAGA